MDQKIISDLKKYFERKSSMYQSLHMKLKQYLQGNSLKCLLSKKVS